jgi:hypothetical protein
MVMRKKRDSSSKSSLISDKFSSLETDVRLKMNVLPNKSAQRKNSSFFNVLPNKSAQITIFIILGILLVLALVLILALRKEVVTFTDKEISPTAQSAVKSFVEACITLISDEALFLIGDQGGYINVPQSISSDASLHLRTSPFTVIPYWAYGENTNVPTLEQVKERIDSHIEQNLPSCLLGMEAFRDSYNIVERKAVKADTSIVDRKTLFRVEWDIEVRDRTGEVVTNLLNFIVESPVKLKRVHTLAAKIIEAEMNQLKFEDITQDLLALEHPQIPLSGREFSCQQKKWKVEDVRERFKDSLRINIGELRVKGTDFVDFSKDLTYYQNHYIWELEDQFYVQDVSTNFIFDNNFPFTFEVRPKNGAYLRSNQLGLGNEILSTICIQTWKFVYDLNFPIIIETIDDTTGYRFKMGSTVHLQRNIPDRSERYYVKPTTSINTFTDDQFCSDARIPMSVVTYSRVFNEQSGVDFSEPLDAVSLRYSCLKYSCEMGETEYGFAGRGDISAVKTNFPYCAGAIMRGSKEGYLDAWTNVASKQDTEVVLELTPLQLFPASNIKILKHTLGRSGKLSSTAPLNDDDTALIKLSFRQNETGPIFHEFSFVKSPGLSDFTRDNKIPFLGQADFIYDLEINLLSGEEISGGYKGKWYVPINQLEQGNEITLHVIDKKPTSDEDLLEIFTGLEEFSKLLPPHEIK